MSQKQPTNPPSGAIRPDPPPAPPAKQSTRPPAAVSKFHDLSRMDWEAKAFRFIRSNSGKFKMPGGRDFDLFLEWESDVMAPDSEFDEAVLLGMNEARFEE